MKREAAVVFYSDAGAQAAVRAKTDFALVDFTPRRRPVDLDMRLAELTAFFTVFSFHMPLRSLTRAASIEAALAAGQKDFCLIQDMGHVFYGYDPLSHAVKQALESCAFATGFTVSGRIARCLLVNRRAWEARGKPAIEPADLQAFEPGVATASHVCAPGAGDIFEWLSVLEDVTRATPQDPALAAAVDFLRNTPDRADAPKKVFVFNSENDADLPQLRHRPGLDSALVLASGFKANRILETLGFHEGTHVVTYDYSAPALGLRKLMIEQWDGRNFAAFFQAARATLESAFPSATYLPPALLKDAGAIDREFAREIASVFTSEAHWLGHWQRFGKLRHSFVEADVIADRDAAKALIEGHAKGNAVMWISDMFNSPNAVGKFSWSRRRAAFDVMANALAAHTASDLILGGAPALWLPA